MLVQAQIESSIWLTTKSLTKMVSLFIEKRLPKNIILGLLKILTESYLPKLQTTTQFEISHLMKTVNTVFKRIPFLIHKMQLTITLAKIILGWNQIK